MTPFPLRVQLPEAAVVLRTLRANTAAALYTLAPETAAGYLAEARQVHDAGGEYYLVVKQGAPYFYALPGGPVRYTGLDLDEWKHVGTYATLTAPVFVRIHHRTYSPFGGYWSDLQGARDATIEAHFTLEPIAAWVLP